MKSIVNKRIRLYKEILYFIGMLPSYLFIIFSAYLLVFIINFYVLMFIGVIILFIALPKFYNYFVIDTEKNFTNITYRWLYLFVFQMLVYSYIFWLYLN